MAVNVSADSAGQPVVIEVLAGDSDPQGEALTVTAVGTPLSGTAHINTDGTVTYTPSSGWFAGVDTFTYTISDGHGGTATATISVTLGTGPSASNQTVSAFTGAATINVLGNVTDPYGDPLTVTSVGSASHGTAYINGEGTVTYVRTAGTTATTDTFTYTIADGHGGTSTATVTVDLQDLPIANNVSLHTPLGTPATINVLAEDHAPVGDVLTVTAVGTPQFGNGTVVINADGTITYSDWRYLYHQRRARGHVNGHHYRFQPVGKSACHAEMR